MSGTSLDGLDVALCRFKGSGLNTSLELLQFKTVPYSIDFKQEIKTIFSKKWVNLEKVCLLNEWVGIQHANIINDCLKDWSISNDDIDIVASHGQTIYHAPKLLHGLEKFTNATLQIGDGDHIAVHTNIITISDFRQKHIAAGGEGAPLAAYGDFLIFSKKEEDRIMLNIGGIANFTFLPGDLDSSKVFCTDVGTGNTLMDAFVQANYQNIYFDDEATIASQGTINNQLLHQLKQHPFFKQSFPKTTGPELFNLAYLETAKAAANITHISNQDTMATLNKFSADSIVDALKNITQKHVNSVVYVSGGRMHNPFLMQHLQ